MTDRVRVVLASASPRRRELLAQIGVGCEVMPADVDETRLPGEAPADYVARVARAKADAVAGRVGDAIVIAADTAVVLDDDVVGKPADPADARAMLARLSARTHTVFSAVVARRGSRTLVRVVPTEVTMRALDADEIAAYAASDEPYDKAGAYAIQGHAAAFVSRIEGSYSGTVGLPLCETLDLIRALDP